MLKNLKAEMIRNGVTGGQMAEAIKIHPATLSAKISEKRVDNSYDFSVEYRKISAG